VIKFITVRIDEKLKKIAKRKVHRDKRAARRPAMPVAPPAMMVPSEPSGGGGPAPGLPGVPKPLDLKLAEPKRPEPEPAEIPSIEPELKAAE